MRVTVVPDALEQAGSCLQSLGGRVQGVQGTLEGAVSGAAGACGFAEASGPLEELASRWAGAVGRSAQAIDGLGANLEASAVAYVVTDVTAIPGVP